MTTPDRPPRVRLLRFLRRRWPLLSAAAVLVAAAAVTAGVLVTDDRSVVQQPTVDGAEQVDQQVTIGVEVITSSGLIGQNHDDVSCVYRELEYELRDESDQIIAVEQISDQGLTAGDADWAALGSVDSDEPYVCSLAWSFDADPAEFYQLRVTAVGIFGSNHQAETSFDTTRANASGSGNPIEIELD